MTKTYLHLPKHAVRYSSRRFPQHAFMNVAYKEDAPKTAEEIEAQLKALTEGLEVKATEAANLAATNLRTDIEKEIGVVKAMFEKVKSVPEGIDLADMNEKLIKTLDGFDKIQNRLKGFKINGSEKHPMPLDEAIKEKMLEFGKVDEYGIYKSEAIDNALAGERGAFTLKLSNVTPKTKAQGADMTLANTLTGDALATYNPRQAIIPAQKINVRDLIPSISTPSGLYVTYSENTGGTNNIIKQTEGALKGENHYDFTEVKTVQSYIAGFTVVTKQILKFLPFLQNTITRLLLRDFYKAENAQFFTSISGAATGGTSGGTSPDDFIQLINVIGAQLDTDYGVSTAVVNNAMMARLIGATYAKGYYPGAGSIVLNDSRGVTVFGVPVIGASWVAANRALLMDNEYVERVEAEGLNVTFSYEDSDNFRRNKVTIKVECMEELNILRPESIIYMNLGAS